MFLRKVPVLNALLILAFLFGPAVSPLRVAVAAPAQAAALADAGFTMIADFEAGIPAGFVAFADSWDGSGSSTSMAVSAAAIELPVLPAEATNQAAKIDYNIAAAGGWGGGPGYGGVTQDFSPAQDWSDYPYFSFLYKGSNPGKPVTIELKSDGPAPANSNRFVTSFQDNFTGWKLVVVPFTAFVKRTDYNPGPNPDAPLNLMKMWGYSLLLPSAASGTIYLDRVAVTGQKGVADFDAGVPAGFVPFADSWDGSGSATTLQFGLAASDPPVIPGVTGDQAIAVTYNIAASGGWGGGPGYGGVTQGYASPVDWSDYQSFSMWFQGSSSGADLRIELKADGAAEGTSNRYVAGFTDNFSGWKFINLPWSAFARRYDYNPGPSPDSPINLMKIWGYSILIPGGAAGSFMLDGVALFGKPAATTVKATFASANYSVDEGGAATVTVKLSSAPSQAVGVSYAATDGTAKTGLDFTAAGGTLEFLAGETEKSFTVQTIQDSEAEINETVQLALSNPTGGAILGLQDTAVLTIVDDDAAQAASGDPFIQVVEDYESGLPFATDSAGNAIGFVTWGDANNTVLSPIPVGAGDPLAYPGMSSPNQLLKIDFNIGGWGGFTHAFQSADGTQWTSQDWSKLEGVSFWLYGANSGGDVNIDIFDNRTTSGDSCERWTYIFKDDFSGWKLFKVPFSAFTRKGWQPGGAPDDGLTLTEVWGYAFGFPAGVGARTMYLDNLGLLVRHTMVDDFESGLPFANDSLGNGIGFVTWGNANNTFLLNPALTDPADPRVIPFLGVPDMLLQVDFNIGAGGWGGFTHAFQSADITQWVSQDWSTYEGVSFWLYGTNTGGEVNIDIFDNRTTSGDSCERWTYIFKDDFGGWKFFRIPFEAFGRKGWQPGGAPDDGLTLTEVWGYAFGFPANVGAQTMYLENVETWGKTSGPAPLPPEFNFAQFAFQVDEGQVATVEVKLLSPAEETVHVDYATSDGSARAGYDYLASSGTLSFAPGEVLKSFTVGTIEDTQYEGNETVVLKLSNPLGAPLGKNYRVELAVVDNDPFDPALVDAFEQPTSVYRFRMTAGLVASLSEARPGDAMAIPGQDPVNTYLAAKVDPYNKGSVPPAIERTFAQPADWSGYKGLGLWYYGTNSGKKVNVILQDNRKPDPGPSGWTLAWNDEFNGAAGMTPDPSKWGYDLGGQGWGNAEYEYYTNSPENASMDGVGNLAIVARKIADPATSGLDCWYGPCMYTSARLLTKDRFDFAYGRAEARLKLPYGQGIWPAFWMLGADLNQAGWPGAGEIDIMENVGKEPNIVHGTVHGPGYSGGNGIGGGYSLPDNSVFSAGFHTYAVEWQPNEIRWYVDGVQFLKVTPDMVPAGNKWVFDHPFFLIMNLAVGGYWPGYPDDTTVFPQTLLVDYVRVYQAPDTAERFEYTFRDSFNGWKWVEVPFIEFKRANKQPAGVPGDGLTLTQVWGYGFSFEAKQEKVYGIDQVKLLAP